MNYPDELTEREMEFLGNVMKQLAYKVIAGEMGITYDTVKSMSRMVHVKTGTHSLPQLIAYGHSIGFDFKGSYIPRAKA